ncbi:MAG: adenylate kinase [Gammaproteobacteria bacterium]|nr:adenylate kinase [Gammaproteobacteria bacterium]
MRIVMLGAPGSGKGTQGKKIGAKYDAPQISTGDLLRAAVNAGSEVGKRAKAAMDAGELVSDEIVLSLIRERLTGEDAAANFILDGFPRNITQAEALDQLLETLQLPIQAALLIDIPRAELSQRLTGRRSCKACGAIFNIYTAPPAVEGVCDRCGGELFQRADDVAETIDNRLTTYEQQTMPLIAYYQQQQKLESVEGSGEVEQIFARADAVLAGLD